MTAGDGKVAVPGKSPAVRPSLWSKDGTDGLGAVPSVLEKSRTVDITAFKERSKRRKCCINRSD